MSFKKDLKLIVKPYYWINIILSLTYIIAKKTPMLCDYLHPYLFHVEEVCEFDSRETEILFFLIIVVMIRSRKTGRYENILKLGHATIENDLTHNLCAFLSSFQRYDDQLPHELLPVYQISESHFMVLQLNDDGRDVWCRFCSLRFIAA